MNVRIFLCLCLLIPLISSAQPQVKWYYDVNDASFGNAAMGDIDKDNKLEIVFSTYRNDSTVYALNAEDGSLLWKRNTGGCNDVAPIIYDVDLDGDLEVILPSSCVAKTFCLNGLTGAIEWQANTRGSDSPPTIADIDNDQKPEILHGEFGGYVICLNGEDGSQAWELAVDLNSWIQTAPVILDLDQNGQLDFVVANWNFGTDHKIFAFRGDNQVKLWDNDLPNDYMYHGASYADLDKDGKPELAIGSYDGKLYVLNGENGSLLFADSVPSPQYVGAPTSIGDLDLDGNLDIVYIDWYTMKAITATGSTIWTYTIPSFATSFRGVALSDITGDDTLDVLFGTSKGQVIALNGARGNLIWSFDLEAHYGQAFDIDHGPVVADFENDGELDVFVVGGHAEYPNIQNNYGRAYAISAGTGNGPDWPMFRRDILRSACVCPIPTGINNPIASDSPSMIVFPNPFSDFTKIILPETFGRELLIEIKNMLGQLVWSKKVEETNFSSEVEWGGISSSGNPVDAGIYLVVMTTIEGLQTIKIIRQ